MGKISGVPTSALNSIDGFYSTQGGGGGTATTTPTISFTAGPFGTGSVTVTNHSSYTNPNYELSVDVGATNVVADSTVDHALDTGSDSLGDTMTFVDSSATTGTRTVSVKAQEFGDNIQSAAATDTYTKQDIQNRYVRFQGVNSSGTPTTNHVFITQMEVYTGSGQTGTEYPTTDLTDYSSETGITVSAGDEYDASRVAWKAFDNSTGTGWWSLGVPTAANNWIQMEFEPATYTPAPVLKSARFLFSSSNSATHLKVLGSDTGAFAGEETDYGYFKIVEGTYQYLG